MRSPKVSVVIGAYNCGKFIEDTVNSVIDQTFRDWELVIVDDGSSDDTSDRVRSITDERIRLIRLEKNSGRPAISRNVGIKNSNGEFIAFLDHDDMWLPEKLEKQVRFMEQNKDIFLLHTKCFVRKDGKDIGIAPKDPKSGHVFNELFLSYNMIGCSTVMMRNRKGAEQYFFNEDKGLITIEDYDLWLSIARKEKIDFIDEPLAIYRMSQDGTLSTYGIFSFFSKTKTIMKKFGPMVPRRILFRKYLSFYIRMWMAYIKYVMAG